MLEILKRFSRMSIISTRLAVIIVSFCCLQPAFANYIETGSNITYDGHFHETGTTKTMWASIYGFWEDDLVEFKINVNGTDYDVTNTAGYDGYNYVHYAEVTVPVTSNPQRFRCYATATMSYLDRDQQPVTFDLDSRDPYEDPDGTSGDGQVTEVITSNIDVKGIKWNNRFVDVYDHVAQVNLPNTNKPYHWRKTPHYEAPAAYQKGQSPQFTFEVEPLTGAVPVRITFDVDLSAYAGTLPNYPFVESGVLGGNTVTVNCPALKDEVNRYTGDLIWSVECQRTDGTWAALYPAASDNRYYIGGLKLFALHNTPNAPMTTPVGTPWIGVLEHSCTWGAGQSTATTLAEALTNNFYFSGEAVYDPNGVFCINVSGLPGTDPEEFFLTDFLNGATAKDGYNRKRMDCKDVSDYLCILANSQGLNFKVTPLYSNPDRYNPSINGGFFTNPICGMGNDPLDNTKFWGRQFTHHQVARAGAGTGAVYDATNAQFLDLSGNVFRMPASNWSLGGYWSSTSPYRGLVAQPNPSAPVPWPATGFSAVYAPKVR